MNCMNKCSKSQSYQTVWPRLYFFWDDNPVLEKYGPGYQGVIKVQAGTPHTEEVAPGAGRH